MVCGAVLVVWKRRIFTPAALYQLFNFKHNLDTRTNSEIWAVYLRARILTSSEYALADLKDGMDRGRRMGGRRVIT